MSLVEMCTIYPFGQDATLLNVKMTTSPSAPKVAHAKYSSPEIWGMEQLDV